MYEISTSHSVHTAQRLNGHWAKMTGELIWINEWISELWVLFHPEGVLFGKCRLRRHLGMSAEKLCDSAQRASQLFKALANENRLTLLYILADGEYSVSELEKIRGLPQPILSQQLARLRKDDLVETRRDGKMIYYSLASAEAREILEVVYDGFVRQT